MSHAHRGSPEVPTTRSLSVVPSVGPDSKHEGVSQKRGTARSGSSCRKKLILCFDGTGNKFRGDSGDSNILKIFRMLDRTGGDQYHYYQPGIGTYITSSSLSHTSIPARINSWYQKVKDSAVGTSFDQHVIGGYKFLMHYYSPGDEIYFFGFSCGAYTARFLAEMLDYVGLVTQGNEETVIFAWKTFSRWQQRHDQDKKHKEGGKDLFNFMKAFRETFTRPVHRIRFLGLFDTVNSVPRFEAAWMQRSKFPYTARSTAKAIRHAVSIDERRAKFRPDLISQEGRRHAKAVATRAHRAHHLSHGHGDLHRPRRKSRVAEKEGHLAIPTVRMGRHEEFSTGRSKRNSPHTIPSPSSKFKTALHEASTKGKIHDCLSFGNGLSAGSVMTWRLMEYLPFKRMVLQPDGSWKPIRFPLPRGEVRDIPDDVKIHNSVLRRMEADPNYRPGNLIVGGGGRGVRVAPKGYGMGIGLS